MKALFQQLAHWVFPPRCVVSGEPLAAGSLDFDLRLLAYLPPFTDLCPVCCEPSPAGKVCAACLSEPPSFDASRIAFAFKDPIHKLVLDYKFGEPLYLAKVLAELWWFKKQAELLTQQKVEALLPVPLHVNRLAQRGFNQSLELAKILSDLSGVPLIATAVRRQRDTPHQTTLNRRERQQNLKQAFVVDWPSLQGVKRVALVDDVVTTGATAEAIAQVLKQSGEVKWVEVWAIAKTTLD